MIDIILPELGEGIDKVEVSDILINLGDEIKIDDPIIVLETEKASMEIPTTKNGIVEQILVEKGDLISKGHIILKISSSSLTDLDKHLDKEEISIEKNSQSDKIKTNYHENKEYNDKEKVTYSEKDLNSPDFGKPALASPSIRKFARELGCELQNIEGTGNKGRVTKEDIVNHVKNNLNKPKEEVTSNIPEKKQINIDFSKWGQINVQNLNNIKRITGKRLQEAWQSIPHVTQFDKCDITELENIRQKLKKINLNPEIKVSLIPFFMKAISKLLIEMPFFNSSLDQVNNKLILKEYINIGIAVNTKNGLIVPVIKDVNNKTIKELSKELTLLSYNARNKQLLPTDMEGGCFTISSLGSIGGTYFTPIINPPEVAILGISKSIFEPVFIENKLKKRLMLPFSLSYDHRVIDGVDAANFTKKFSQIIENLEEII